MRAKKKKKIRVEAVNTGIEKLQDAKRHETSPIVALDLTKKLRDRR